MNSRIQQFIEAEGLTPTRFADAIGVQRSNVSHVLAGRNKPGYDFLEKMLRRYPELNAYWLMLGVGSMYRDDNPTKELPEPTLFSDNPYQNIVSDEAPVPYLYNTKEKQKAADLKSRSEEQAKPINEAAQTPSVQAGKQLAKVLLCYSDGSFEVFGNK